MQSLAGAVMIAKKNRYNSANLCFWTCPCYSKRWLSFAQRIQLEKSFITCFDLKERASLSTESILYEGAPPHLLVSRRGICLPGRACESGLATLALTASCLWAKNTVQTVPGSLPGSRKGAHSQCFSATATRDMVGMVRHHKYLLGQVVPAMRRSMRMVTTSRFLYSASLVPWTEAELDKLDTKWLQIQRKAWKLPPGYPSAPLSFPSACGGCAEMHPLVPMIQALAKHVEQLVQASLLCLTSCVRRQSASTNGFVSSLWQLWLSQWARAGHMFGNRAAAACRPDSAPHPSLWSAASPDQAPCLLLPGSGRTRSSVNRGVLNLEEFRLGIHIKFV